MDFLRRHAYFSVTLIWLIVVVAYGWVEVSAIMADLRVSPSPDRYANDFGFQIFAFVSTKGLLALLVLGLVIWSTAYMSRSSLKMRNTCGMCGRKLDQKDDPLSVDCGGDCWGCIGEFEADMGDEYSLAKVREEFALGLRPNWVDASSNLSVEKRK